MYAFIALMPFIWRSRRKSFSNSADTPSIARCSGDLAGFGPSGRCGTISVSPRRRNCISVSNSLRPWWLEPEAFSALETTVPAARLEYLSQLVVTELGRAADGSGCRPKKGARGEQADNGGMSLRHVAQTVGLDYQCLRHLPEKQGVYKVPPPNGRPWSEREVRVLRDYGTPGRSLHTTAAKLARTSKAVSSKAAQLGLSWAARIPGNPRTRGMAMSQIDCLLRPYCAVHRAAP